MTRLTAQLVRKKAEHHDGIIGDLEEISLHQLELEKLEVVGELCRKLRILYLQNNIIPRIENIQYLKDLRYLNMALNNVQAIEGLQQCEFLEKLDLTVNFIDLDTFEDSIQHLQPLVHFTELFLMGNPAMEWEHARDFVVATLPQLKRLDGKDITRTERIKATQRLSAMTSALRAAAPEAAARKAARDAEAAAAGAGDDDSSPWTPAARVELYREVQEQKEEDAARKAEMEPRKRDADKEFREKVAATRDAEAATTGPAGSEPSAPLAAAGGERALPRMANEGRIDFTLEDEDGRGNCILRLPLPRFMDSSLVDVDVHPLYVSVVVKNKLFRLHWPEEVRPDAGTAKRSSASGELVITVPKVAPREVYMSMVRKEKAEAKAAKREARKAGGGGAPTPKPRGGGGTVMDLAMQAAAAAKGGKKSKASKRTKGGKKSVSLAGIVPGAPTTDTGLGELLMTEVPKQAAAPAPPACGVPKEAQEGEEEVPMVDEAGGAREHKMSPGTAELD